LNSVNLFLEYSKALTEAQSDEERQKIRVSFFSPILYSAFFLG